MRTLIEKFRGTPRLLTLLIAANIAIWVVALAVYAGQPAALGPVVLAYLLGVRHGFDADHVAAIDAASRKLVQQDRSAKLTGLFFALGHSTIVVLLSLALILPTRLVDRADITMPEGFGIFGSVVSVVFLVGLSLVNAITAARLWGELHRVRKEEGRDEPVQSVTVAQLSAPISWLLRGLFRFVGRSWHMYPIGVLFGLGFDTASEVALLALSAERAADGVGMWMIMIYPALFAAGMSLVDTIDSVMINRAYRWAGDDHRRNLVYSLIVTMVTITFAVVVAAMQLGNLVGSVRELSGPLWSGLRIAWDHSGTLGMAAVLLVAFWNLAPLLRRTPRRASP